MASGLDIGRSFSHYRIVSKIGEGGMGEVYLAEDTELGRQVALKVLLSEVAGDEDRVRRFVQEAKAASALNHPNILTVYEIGTFEDSRFIATELIKGQTLRDRMRRDAMTLREVLDVAMQVAAALNAAHSAGIVHRDIKPENIMLRDDGFVKVLDFGLAKLAADPNATADSEDATRAQVNTKPGVVMGTVAYMSPEQARGKETDARCDIWSLGIVMYEMLTKRTPFAGETTSDSIAAILKQEPELLGPETPSELQRIIRKSLQKNADERYQTVKDLLLDVKSLKRELEFSDELERSRVPHATGSANVSTGQMTENATAMHSDLNSTQNSMPQHRSSAEYVVGEIKAHKWAVAGVAAFLLLMIGTIFGIYKYSGAGISAKKEFSLAEAKITKLTTSGKASAVAISPDGKYVVHVQDDGGQQSLYMRQVATQSNVQILPPAPINLSQLQFSPDGNYIYYFAIGRVSPRGELFQLPTLGGSPKKILENLNGHISFSPEGSRFVFDRKVTDTEQAVFVVNIDGKNEEKLTGSKPSEFYDNIAWSPDGKKIVYESWDMSPRCILLELRVADRTVRQLTDQSWPAIFGLVWMSDGGSLLMLALEKPDGPVQIWQISYPGGPAKQLTNDPDGFSAISIAADSGTLAVVKSITNSNIFVAPYSDQSQFHQVTSGSGKADNFPSWAPNGRIFFDSTVSGNEDIWTVNLDGSDLRRITNDGATMPSVSPDGRSIVFSSIVTGNHIWQMNIDGSNARQITKGENFELEPKYSQDGGSIYYLVTFPSENQVWRIPADGIGEPAKVFDKQIFSFCISPDNKLIAYSYQDDDKGPNRLAIVPIDGGSPIQTFPLPSKSGESLRWTPDGRNIVYLDTSPNGVGNLLAQPVKGGEPKKLTDFKSDRIFSLDVSRDGRQIALSRGNVASDVLLYTNIK